MPGDIADIVQRMRTVLPRGWFADNAPNLTAVLSCLATPAAWLYSCIQYATQQMRIASASEVWLDLIAWDFFGPDLRRANGESDSSLRSRILQALFAEAATRPAVHAALTQLTGCEPVIFEPTHAPDTGVYASWPELLAGAPPALAYGVVGGWGSLRMPYQFMVTAKRASATGLMNLAGYGSPAGGYGMGTFAWTEAGAITGNVSDTMIQQAITRALAVNATAWLRIV